MEMTDIEMPATAVSPEETARSLWVIYQQLPDNARQVFRAMVLSESAGEYVNEEWLALAATSLKTLWDAPEENYWDELYAKQHPQPPVDAG